MNSGMNILPLVGRWMEETLLTFETELTTLLENLWSLNKQVLDPNLRRELGRILTSNMPKFSQGAPSPAASELHAKGFASLGGLAARFIPEIQSQLCNCPLYNAEDFSYQQALIEKKTFQLSDRPANVFLAGVSFEDLIRCTSLLKLACDPTIVEAVRSYLGCPPTISAVQAWYTFPGQSDIPAEMFHRDRDDFNFVKLFVYLSDVGPQDGPHQYIPYSHRVDTLQQYFRAKGASVDLRPLFQGNSRNLTPGDLDRLFAKDIMTLTASAGFAFLEDTYGLHRGTRPTGATRLIFSTLYTGLPLRYANENDRIYEMSRRVTFAEAGLEDASDLERYMLRFYLQ